MTGWRAIRPLIGYLVRLALGDRLLLALFLLMVLGAALAAFVGSTALVERRELATVFAAAAARLAVAMALALFTCFQLRREFDTREVDILLSRPISRPSFVLAHLVTLLLFAAAATALAALLVGAIARPSVAALGLWTLSVFVEAAIVAAVALFFALMLSSGVASVLAALGFYVLARTIGLLAGVAAAQSQAGPIERLLDLATSLLGLILPRLDLLGQSAWLVHGVGAEAGVAPVLIQSAVYVVLLGAAASFDFGRRQL